MTSLTPQHLQHPHHPQRTEATMQNKKHSSSNTSHSTTNHGPRSGRAGDVPSGAALMATLTRIAVVVLEAAVLLSVFRHARETFERETVDYVAGDSAGVLDFENPWGDPKRAAHPEVPPPVRLALAASHTTEVA